MNEQSIEQQLNRVPVASNPIQHAESSSFLKKIAAASLLAGSVLGLSSGVQGEGESGDFPPITGMIPADTSVSVKLTDSITAQPQIAPNTVSPDSTPPNRVIVANITGTQTAGPGYVQGYLNEPDLNAWSNLNFDGPGQTRPNLAFLTPDDDGYANFYTLQSLHLIVDVQGDITEGVNDVPDERLVDSRGISGNLPMPGAGSFTEIDCEEPNAVVVGNLTAAFASGNGYLEIVPEANMNEAGKASHINYVGGQTIARLAVAECNDMSKAYIYSPFGNAHILFDKQVLFKNGVYTPNENPRSFDSRETGQKIKGGNVAVIQGKPNSTAVIGLVGTNNTSPMYLQVLGEGVVRDTTSDVNLDRTNGTSGSLVIASFDQNGQLEVYASTHGDVDVVADVYGYLADGAFEDLPNERVYNSMDLPDYIPEPILLSEMTEEYRNKECLDIYLKYRVPYGVAAIPPPESIYDTPISSFTTYTWRDVNGDGILSPVTKYIDGNVIVNYRAEVTDDFVCVINWKDKDNPSGGTAFGFTDYFNR